MPLVHASCVSIGDAGVLLRGAPGSGKSDLALRLIDGGGVLVADDQVSLSRDGPRLVATPPAELDGLLEVRGLGIVNAPARHRVALALIVDLRPDGADQRLPVPDHCGLQGIELPRLVIAPQHASAAAIIRLAVRTLSERGSLAGALGDAVDFARGAAS